jgi:hypothetical protein
LPYPSARCCLISGVLFLAFGCTENTGLHPSQGTGGSGGRSSGAGAAGGAEGGTTAWSGVCSEAPCLGPLFVPCQPSGSCVSNSPSSGVSNQPITNCYSNGVKQQVAQLDSDGGNISVVLTQKRDSKVCFTIRAGLTAGGDASYAFFDGGGRQVARGASAITDSESVIVTCNGGSPVELSQACMDTVNFGGDSCSTGRCTF